MARIARIPRALSDDTLAVTPIVAKQALSKLAKPSLCALALAWLDDQHSHPAVQRKRPRPDRDEDSDESDDEQHLERGLKDTYETIRDDAGVSRARVVQSILSHWNRGLSYRQVAQVDVQYLKDKPRTRSWTAYQLKHALASPAYTTSAQLATRLRAALSPYHNHHLYVDSTSSLTTLRLQLLPTSPLLPTPTPLLLLHLPQTPYLLLPTLPSSLAPIVLQCLCTALSTPPAREANEIQLRGRDWRGLRDILLGRMSSGAMTKWREGRGEGGGPLVPAARRVLHDGFVSPTIYRLNQGFALAEPLQSADSKGEEYIPDVDRGRIVQDDPHLAQARGVETGAVFGREALPVLERLDYEISLPYPGSTDEPPEPFLLRFEGTHVLEGLRAAADKGFADDGFPKWIGRVAQEGRNALRVGKDVEA